MRYWLLVILMNVLFYFIVKQALLNKSDFG